MNVIGYAYNAALHCAECTAEKFPDADAEYADVTDDEGNDVHPLFSTDEQEQTPHCDDCGEVIE